MTPCFQLRPRVASAWESTSPRTTVSSQISFLGSSGMTRSSLHTFSFHQRNAMKGCRVFLLIWFTQSFLFSLISHSHKELSWAMERYAIYHSAEFMLAWNFIFLLTSYRSTLKCTHCGHESVTFEPFWTVSVPVPKPKPGQDGPPVTISNCLQEFVKVGFALRSCLY